MQQACLGFTLFLSLVSQSSATDIVSHKIHLSDGNVFLSRYTYLTSEEAAKAVAKGVIEQIPNGGRAKVAYEVELLDGKGALLAKRRYDHQPPKPEHGMTPVHYECVEGVVRDGRIYMLLRCDYGYSDDYCFQVHSFADGKIAKDFVYTGISMERASRGPSCKKIELLSYDERGNIEVMIHPRVGKDLTPYRRKFGPNGDPSNDKVK